MSIHMPMHMSGPKVQERMGHEGQRCRGVCLQLLYVRHMSKHTSMHMSKHTFVHTSTHTCLCMCLYTCAYVYVDFHGCLGHSGAVSCTAISYRTHVSTHVYAHVYIARRQSNVNICQHNVKCQRLVPGTCLFTRPCTYPCTRVHIAVGSRTPWGHERRGVTNAVGSRTFGGSAIQNLTSVL